MLKLILCLGATDPLMLLIIFISFLVLLYVKDVFKGFYSVHCCLFQAFCLTSLNQTFLSICISQFKMH